jgi:stearoyl-CoA desaturase (delta-9 desaturase)
VLAASHALRTVHEFRQRLVEIWEQANVSNEALVAHLREWCAQAEASGIEALQQFSARLRGYLPAPMPA